MEIKKYTNENEYSIKICDVNYTETTVTITETKAIELRDALNKALVDTNK